MASKKRKKKNSKAKNIMLLMMLCLSVFFLFSLVSELLETTKLKESIAIADKEEKKLSQKKTDLNEEKKKLEDPQYILRLARGKYLATKEDGEQVFKLQDEK